MEHQQDSRRLTVTELLLSLKQKFDSNFAAGTPHFELAAQVESNARLISRFASELQTIPGILEHQRMLASHLDEAFADSVCSLYFSSQGLNVAARMLLRRTLELSLCVALFWDSPADFWDWYEHDGDVKFSTFLARLQSQGYSSFLRSVNQGAAIDLTGVCSSLQKTYSELSNVVHPKPYNFTTTAASRYSFSLDEFTKTIRLADATYGVITTLFRARFPVSMLGQT